MIQKKFLISKPLEENALIARILSFAVMVKAANLAFESTDLIPKIIENWLLIIILVELAYCIFRYFRIKRLRFNAMVLLLSNVYLLGYIYAFLICNGYQSLIFKRAIWTLLFGMLCFMCSSAIKDAQVFLEEIYYWSFAFTLLGTIMFVGKSGTLSSDMTFSSMMLFPFAIHIVWMRQNRSILLRIIIIYELTIIFLHGSRGGLLFSVLGLLILLLHDYKINKRTVIKKIMHINGIVFICIILFVNISKLLEYFEEKGIYIRNLAFLLGGSFMSDNGRNDIYIRYANKIMDNSFFRFSVLDQFKINEAYPHNVFIEIVYDYGLFLGTIIAGIIILYTIRQFAHLKDKEWRLYLVFLISGLFPLLTSFTYLEWPLFWAFLGCLMAFDGYKRRRLLLNHNKFEEGELDETLR